MRQHSIAAFHVIWTKPTVACGKEFCMNEAEILTLIVSALMWQKHNGTVKLYTDNAGYEFIKKQDLLGLWDGGIDTKVLEDNNYPIDPETFWAAGKLIALETQTAPCVMLDTDLIVMQPIYDLLESSSVTALHAEPLNPDVYLKPSLLKQPKGYKFPDYYNWEVQPSNTAFLYIKDELFKAYYLNESKKFMFDNTEKPQELISQMVFAEQRLLSICVDSRHLRINHLLANPFSTSNHNVIHLWGFKNLLRKSNAVQTVYSKQLIQTVEDELSTNVFFQHYTEKQRHDD
jgi:hypothetical protein